jgi:hypothetical protein
MRLAVKEEGRRKGKEIKEMMVGGKIVEKQLEEFKSTKSKRKQRRNRNKEKGEKKTHVLSTIVQMLDVITSFNFNCYSPMMD